MTGHSLKLLCLGDIIMCSNDWSIGHMPYSVKNKEPACKVLKACSIALIVAVLHEDSIINFFIVSSSGNVGWMSVYSFIQTDVGITALT